jgi:hypothetical protein
MKDIYFEVSADWMRTCGLGNKACIFRVLDATIITSIPRRSTQNKIAVDRDGWAWFVPLCHGRYVSVDPVEMEKAS